MGPRERKHNASGGAGSPGAPAPNGPSRDVDDERPALDADGGPDAPNAPASARSGTLAPRLDFAEWASRELTDSLPDCVSHFLISLRSPHTRRCYQGDLREFLEFLGERGLHPERVGEITERMLLAWQSSLETKHAQYAGSRRRVVQSSVARKLSSVSSLLAFALKRKLIERNPSELLNRPKVRRESKTNAFTAAEVRAVLLRCRDRADALRAEGGRPYRSWALRYTVLHTLFSVGMRVDELLELRVGDLEVAPECARLHMTAKGSENHSPVIHPETAATLLRYIEEFRPGAPRDAFLFTRAQAVREETKLTQAAVYEMITAVAKDVGIDKKVSPHSCRASLATMLHDSGVPIGHIQDLLNHKQITTTAIYIKKAESVRDAAATKVDVLSGGALGSGT